MDTQIINAQPTTSASREFHFLTASDDTTQLSCYFTGLTVDAVKKSSSALDNGHKHGPLRLASFIHSALVEQKIDFARPAAPTTTSQPRDGKFSRYTGYVVAEEFGRGASLLLSSFVDLIGSVVHPASFDVSSFDAFKKDVKACIDTHGIRAGSMLTVGRLIMTGISLIVSLGQAAIDALLFILNKLSALVIGAIVHFTVFAVPLVGKGLLFVAGAAAYAMVKTGQAALFPFAAIIREVRAAYNKERFSSEEHLEARITVKIRQADLKTTLSNLDKTATMYDESDLRKTKATAKNETLALVGEQKAFVAKAKEQVTTLNERVLGSIPTHRLERAATYFTETTAFEFDRPHLSDADRFIKNASDIELAEQVQRYTPNIPNTNGAHDIVRGMHLQRLLLTKGLLNGSGDLATLTTLQCALAASDEKLLEMAIKETEQGAFGAVINVNDEGNLTDKKLFYDDEDEDVEISENQISLLGNEIVSGIAYYAAVKDMIAARQEREEALEAYYSNKGFKAYVSEKIAQQRTSSALEEGFIPPARCPKGARLSLSGCRDDLRIAQFYADYQSENLRTRIGYHLPERTQQRRMITLEPDRLDAVSFDNPLADDDDNHNLFDNLAAAAKPSISSSSAAGTSDFRSQLLNEDDEDAKEIQDSHL